MHVYLGPQPRAQAVALPVAPTKALGGVTSLPLMMMMSHHHHRDPPPLDMAYDDHDRNVSHIHGFAWDV